MRNFITGLCLVGFLVGGIIGLRFLGFNMFKYFAPREAAVEREVFENTKGYNDGMIRDLENLMLEYKKLTNKEQKEALRSVILHRFSVYPSENLSPDLRSFYNDLKSE